MKYDYKCECGNTIETDSYNDRPVCDECQGEMTRVFSIPYIKGETSVKEQ